MEKNLNKKKKPSRSNRYQDLKCNDAGDCLESGKHPIKIKCVIV